jgi:hypothetical protein
MRRELIVNDYFKLQADDPNPFSVELLNILYADGGDICAHSEKMLSQFGHPRKVLTIWPSPVSGIMNRNPRDSINPAPASSRYTSTFQLSQKKKSWESTASSSSVSRKKKTPFVLKTKLPPSMNLIKAFKQLLGPLSRRSASLSSFDDTETSETTESSEPSTPNVLDFLIGVCPEDVLPKILAFAGPQKIAALSKVNRVWRDVIAEEWTWRVLCEDLYKVRSCSFFVSFLFQRLVTGFRPRTRAPRNHVAGFQNALVLPN